MIDIILSSPHDPIIPYFSVSFSNSSPLFFASFLALLAMFGSQSSSTTNPPADSELAAVADSEMMAADLPAGSHANAADSQNEPPIDGIGFRTLADTVSGWLVQTRNCEQTLKLLKESEAERRQLQDSLEACEDKLAEVQLANAKANGQLLGAKDHIARLTAKLNEKENVEVDCTDFSPTESISKYN